MTLSFHCALPQGECWGAASGTTVWEERQSGGPNSSILATYLITISYALVILLDAEDL